MAVNIPGFFKKPAANQPNNEMVETIVQIFDKYAFAPMTATEIAGHLVRRGKALSAREVEGELRKSPLFSRKKTPWGLTYEYSLEHPIRAESVGLPHWHAFNPARYFNVEKILGDLWAGKKHVLTPLEDGREIFSKMPSTVYPQVRGGGGTHLIAMCVPKHARYDLNYFTLVYLPGPELAKLVAHASKKLWGGGPSWHHFPGGLVYLNAAITGETMKIGIQGGFTEEKIQEFVNERDGPEFQKWTKAKISRVLRAHSLFIYLTSPF
jgi:hypothetical protein